MTSNTSLLVATMLLVVLLAAYGYITFSKYELAQPVPQGQTAPTAQIANPASTHCVDLGGSLEIREDATGAQAGYCHLPDGRVCEEWALFRDGTCVDSQ